MQRTACLTKRGKRICRKIQKLRNQAEGLAIGRARLVELKALRIQAAPSRLRRVLSLKRGHILEPAPSPERQIEFREKLSRR